MNIISILGKQLTEYKTIISSVYKNIILQSLASHKSFHLKVIYYGQSFKLRNEGQMWLLTSLTTISSDSSCQGNKMKADKLTTIRKERHPLLVANYMIAFLEYTRDFADKLLELIGFLSDRI
jgi:hypothetical protein